jgi:hypothetical protein
MADNLPNLPQTQLEFTDEARLRPLPQPQPVAELLRLDQRTLLRSVGVDAARLGVRDQNLHSCAGPGWRASPIPRPGPG